MSWEDAAAAADAASFAHTGYAALWRVQGQGAGVACRARLAREGEVGDLLGSSLTTPGAQLRLLKSEVPTPAEGDTIEATIGANVVTYTLRGDPYLAPGERIWICEIDEETS